MEISYSRARKTPRNMNMYLGTERGCFCAERAFEDVVNTHYHFVGVLYLTGYNSTRFSIFPVDSRRKSR